MVHVEAAAGLRRLVDVVGLLDVRLHRQVIDDRLRLALDLGPRDLVRFLLADEQRRRLDRLAPLQPLRLGPAAAAGGHGGCDNADRTRTAGRGPAVRLTAAQRQI